MKRKEMIEFLNKTESLYFKKATKQQEVGNWIEATLMFEEARQFRIIARFLERVPYEIETLPEISDGDVHPTPSEVIEEHETYLTGQFPAFKEEELKGSDAGSICGCGYAHGPK
jgi:hypothetical protein